MSRTFALSSDSVQSGKESRQRPDLRDSRMSEVELSWLPREHTRVPPGLRGSWGWLLGQGELRLRAGSVGQAALPFHLSVLVLWADVITLVTSLPHKVFEDINFNEIPCTYRKMHTFTA